MTIKSDWMHIWKKENKAAFSPKCQHPIDVVFIDGQIKLMKSTFITTWKDLIYWQFASPIKKYFAMGASTVVLAFDDYDHVPASKNMTQNKRQKHTPQMSMHGNEVLPASIPHNWSQCIMNRTFKTKVIHLIAATVPQLIQLAPHQTLIIDYKGHPLVYTATKEPTELEHMVPMGEADIKFTRYTEMGNMLVEATDGDYIPIALMRIEEILNTRVEPPHISIYRMEINLNGPKRTLAGDVKYTYEYVHMNQLYKHLMMSIFAKVRVRPDTDSRPIAMQILAMLISYTGCDFSKGLPYVSAKRIWDNLGMVWACMTEAVQDTPATEAGAWVDVDTVTNKAISRLYGSAYKKHIPNDRLPMKDIADKLKRHSMLSDMVKGRLPELQNVECVVKNGNWVVAYWRCLETYPSPMAGDYGFKFNKKGRPIWEDDQ